MQNRIRSGFSRVLLLGTASFISPYCFAADGASQTMTVAAADSGAVQEVVVEATKKKEEAGGGLLRVEDAAKSLSTVSDEFIAKQATIKNPIQFLTLLPGTNVSSADPYGVTSNNITVRGMNSDQIGFTLEGAPLNDPNNYAIYPNEYVDAENLQSISLAQGSADLDSPTFNASGGLIKMTLRDPAYQFGGLANVSVGSSSMSREFVRVDSGVIPGTNVRSFVSYSHFYDDHWRGPGSDHKQHVDFKAVSEIDENNRLSLAVTYDDSFKSQYRNPSLSQWNASGTSFNYDSTFSALDNNYIGVHHTPYNVLIVSAPAHLQPARDLTLDITPYFFYNTGTSASATTISESAFYSGTTKFSGDLNGNGVTSDRVLVYAPYETPYLWRPGIQNKLTYQLANHTLVGGYWYDYSQELNRTSPSVVQTNGTPYSDWNDTGNIRLSDGSILRSQNNRLKTQTQAFFFGDTIATMDDRLFFDLGVKQVYVDRTGYNYLPGTTARVTMNSSETLPTAAARFKLDQRSQIFASVSTNFRTPTAAALFDSTSLSTGAITAANSPDQKTEESIAEEIGYRYHDETVIGSISFFNYNFRNRQVSTLINAVQSANINAGGQTSRGIDVELGTQKIYNVRPYVSFEYLDATIDSDYPVGTDYLPTKGKTAVRSPKETAALGLDYDDGKIFANAQVKYVGAQYATFMNDQKMPAFTTADLAFGYRLPQIDDRTKPEIKLNLMNITDEKYLGGVASVSANSVATRGIRGSMIGATGTPTYYVGSGFAVVATLSSTF